MDVKIVVVWWWYDDGVVVPVNQRGTNLEMTSGDGILRMNLVTAWR